MRKRDKFRKRTVVACAIWLIAFVIATVAIFVDNKSEGNWGGLAFLLFVAGIAIIFPWEKI